MARADQYIGLTSRAHDFIKTLDIDRTEKYGMCDQAFSLYPLRGIRIICKPDYCGKIHIYEEKVQCSPWSSGPMYFTYLNWKIIQDDGDEFDCDHLYKWTVDPLLKNEQLEYCRQRGSYYI